MQCYKHPEVDAIGACITCGRAVCCECIESKSESDLAVCTDCAENQRQSYLEDINKKIARCWRIPFCIVFAIIALIGALYLNGKIEKELQRVDNLGSSGIIGFGRRHYSDGRSEGYVYGSRRHREMERQNLKPLYYFRNSAFVFSGFMFLACAGWTLYYFKTAKRKKAFLSTGEIPVAFSDNKPRQERKSIMSNEKKGSIGAGILWMLLISLLLFWLPVIGPLIAGIAGGKRAGGVGAAIVAVFLPGIIFGVVLFVLASHLSGIPILGAIAGVGGFALSLVHIGPLLIGAIIGGILA